MIDPADLRYTPSHEWVMQREDDTLRVGITEFLQQQLSDIVSVDLPEPDRGELRSAWISRADK